MILNTDKFLTALVDDIHNNRLVLPTMPEVAVKVRETVEGNDVTSKEIATLIGADAALSARIVQIANSPMMRGNAPITDLPMAITRLGYELVRDLVITLAMEQLYHAKSAALKRYLRELWKHSTQVAAICYVFSSRFTTLHPEQAMLAGLLHKIGVLPIIKQFEANLELLKEPGLLDQVINAHHTIIGHAILEAWNFPDEIVMAVTEHEDIERDSGPEPDYADVVLIANLHSYIGTDHPLARVNWDTIPSFSKLGLSPEESIKALEKARDDVNELQNLFGN